MLLYFSPISDFFGCFFFAWICEAKSFDLTLFLYSILFYSILFLWHKQYLTLGHIDRESRDFWRTGRAVLAERQTRYIHSEFPLVHRR